MSIAAGAADACAVLCPVRTPASAPELWPDADVAVVPQARADAISIPTQEQVESFQATLDAASLLRAQIRAYVHAPTTALPFLQPGRLVRLLADTSPAEPGEHPALAGLPRRLARQARPCPAARAGRTVVVPSSPVPWLAHAAERQAGAADRPTRHTSRHASRAAYTAEPAAEVLGWHAEASTSGREVDAVQLEEPCVWGALVGYQKQAAKGTQAPRVVIDVLARCHHSSFTASGPKRWAAQAGLVLSSSAQVLGLPVSCAGRVALLTLEGWVWLSGLSFARSLASQAGRANDTDARHSTAKPHVHHMLASGRSPAGCVGCSRLPEQRSSCSVTSCPRKTCTASRATRRGGRALRRRPWLVPAAEEGRCLVCALPLTDLVAFSSLRIYLDSDLKRSDTRARGLQGAPRRHSFPIQQVTSWSAQLACSQRARVRCTPPVQHWG